jgi:cell shape-determining protein MreC
MLWIQEWWRSYERVQQLEAENAQLREALGIKQAIIDDMAAALASKRALLQRIVADVELEGGL